MSHDPTPLPPEMPADSTGPASDQEQVKDQAQVKANRHSTPLPDGRSANTDVTRAGMVWVGVIAGLVILVLLIIFILQNQDRVEVHFFGMAGALSIGMALFIAAVAGGILVAIAGAVRILQLRRQRRRQAVRARSQPGSGARSGAAERPVPGATGQTEQ
ncbi:MULTISPECIES: lipopolysaccharide assembly protein LapA domain-containing protein [Arthrobacter]|uniref:lipopolysaccharide assembly protein LapA domain-containing protein n=1 Tax=Arthrobacter TaxID=1663 RepID=UPI0009ECA482|nr:MULTISPECIES: lipopolysaccharide assembly protein LapA domain-containing protein [Arthrobacter]